MVAVIAFLASIGQLSFTKILLYIVTFLSEGFLVGEFFFDEMSSVKSRKHFVVADLAFSGSSHTQEPCSWSHNSPAECER